ncbi:ATP-binding cassette domain-containing protein [Sulfidibacter corallicola]|uniref:ATP-binding cassette domain-containing protein n=1 Tax=Sulfidibacter corallicola TaxID=2818388 RepID=A0A8A4TFR5_SULCO|nr:ATP-binding cassette domain-containing protein [Sulfidibacter corallicola]QTD48032.1 ATP-binding cassette domain-containing protein [Sulfidibacter corallicola]
MNGLELWSWPQDKLGECLEALARRANLSPKLARAPHLPEDFNVYHHESLSKWIVEACGWLKIEAEPVEIPFGQIHDLLRRGGPALLTIASGGGRHFVALCGSHRGHARVLGPDSRIYRLPFGELEALIVGGVPESEDLQLDLLLDTAGVPLDRRAQTRFQLARNNLNQKHFDQAWLLRLPPEAPLYKHLGQARVTLHFAALVVFYIMAHLLFVGSWWVIIKGVLEGRIDQATLLAWVLMLLSIVPFRMLTTWAQGLVSLGIGGVFKERLLRGIQRLDPEEIRGRGSGQLLGLVLESRTLESLSLNAGYSALFSVIELGIALALLFQAEAWWLAWLLIVWTIPIALFFRTFQRRWESWTDLRLQMTNDLVESMYGHDTRLAQEPRDTWHKNEDWSLARYFQLSLNMELHGYLLMNFSSRGWLILGVIGLIPLFAWGGPTPESVAMSLGGILLAFRALYKQRSGFLNLISALVAWRNTLPLIESATRAPIARPPSPSLSPMDLDTSIRHRNLLLEAYDLVYRYQRSGQPVLRADHFTIREGERILIEGRSGSGKSTFAALLLGLRNPDSGLVLIHGLDRHTLGEEGWRRCISGAPQFHVNHIFSGSLAFNLLMGRGWPPCQEDLEEAEEICNELGLSPLLSRMPAGLMQLVGDNGWQLSHGEASRVFIARALLQHAELIILDESFGALDPESLQQAMACVFRRARTLIVIAHP